ncbi:SWIM zinc finger-containing protein [Sphaerochaeta pleomorpha str. Grapes]|uniref:SWIM zinc finger-containing protein n=1 Tax=Sphaerochaeta pleomorpha (strain ATCC BAA-1885 / DSM 22778 / Grapes) TaxID=158190 RepID=G8QY20_SPHPG|nr:SWIM zinc finger family protein [Sphaerochaeta pleomorpha]AEV28525.1 SWIM zinc finger-containing protein [Sphaerochaeta pleomorpha str. Grapes]
MGNYPYDNSFPSYHSTSAAEVKANARKTLAKSKKTLHPVILEGRTIAKTWWGKAWCNNLERYSDYANRIGRGRSYVRSGAVLDLQMEKGLIKALVQGSRSKPYSVTIGIDALSPIRWDAITKACSHRIASMDALLEGQFPHELEMLFTDLSYGLFPAPKEIHIDCNCPDWAILCKHAAAVLYAVGSRLDEDPLHFFTLRSMDFSVLLQRTVEEKSSLMLQNAGKPSARTLPEEVARNLFGM